MRIFNSEKGNVDLGILAYRVLVAASLLFVHGFGKLSNLQEEAATFPDPFKLGVKFTFCFAIFASVICPLMIMLGLLTRMATLGVAAVTLTGLFIVHLHDPLVVKDTPYMYSVAMMLIFIIGPGKYSIDQWITNRKRI